jgi:type IV pilus assembly protein PilQ
MKKYNTFFGAGVILYLSCSLLFAGQGYIESMKFKDTDIRTVLDAIASEASKEGENVNIVAAPEIQGLVSIDLKNVDWRTALKVILSSYNYAYVQHGTVITVSAVQGSSLQAGLKMELFKFKYLYADVARKLITPLLSVDGKVSILDIPEDRIGDSSQMAAAATSYSAGSAAYTGGGMSSVGIGPTTGQGSSGGHSKVLIVYDTAEKLDQISTTLSELDVMPQQILIQAIIMEVNQNRLKDIGFDWGTGLEGAIGNATAVSTGSGQITGSGLVSQVTPGVFSPFETGGLTSPAGQYPFNTGLQLLFQKIGGSKLSVMLHALEEDAQTNTLSKPVILATNNQLASILIGTQFPIIQTQTSTESSYIVGGSLQQYMNIGIQLKVRPQICGPNDEYINLVVHPIVSSYSQTVKVTTQPTTTTKATTLAEYPIIDTREAETQMVVKDGEAIVMGGLLKNVKKDENLGIPFLRKLPLLGRLFDRSTNNDSKVDLMIFITAKIVRPGEVLPQEILDTHRVKEQFEERQEEKSDQAKRKSNK